MLVSDIKNNFLEELKEEYPREEINSFFYLLAEAFLGMSRLELALDPNLMTAEAEIGRFEDALERLKQHEPVQHIIGETEFFGLKFRVNTNVLIPRPETEELVQWVLDDSSSEKKELKILDIGTGSGCIAVSLAKNLPQAEVFAIDISEAALKIARQNSEENGVKVNFIQADVLKLDSLAEQFDVIVSNPPYVRELEKKEMHKNVLNFEPQGALYVKDENPLVFYNKIAKLAQQALRENGVLYFEINQYLGHETEEMLKNAGFQTELRKDIFDNFRMLKGIKQ